MFDASNDTRHAYRVELADELQRTCDSARTFCQHVASRAMHTLLVSACEDPFEGCCCRTIAAHVSRPPSHKDKNWPSMAHQYCELIASRRLR